MVRSLDQISKDLTKLETMTTQIDTELQALYQDYLSVLGKAVKRQLILAVYHLCTQAYPDKFLALSVNQREKVQAGVRQIAMQGQTQIQQLGQAMDISSLADKLEEAVTARYQAEVESTDNEEQEALTDEAPVATVGEADAEYAEDLELPTAALPEGEDLQEAGPEETDWDAMAIADVDMATENSAVDLTAVEFDPEQPSSFAEASQDASEMMHRLSNSLSLLSVLGAEPLSPVSLAKRHVLLERHLRAVLQTLSNLSNYLLKEGHILPDLPEMVITAAAEAETGEASSGTPNVLNVLVEVGSDRAEAAEHDDHETEDEGEEGDLFTDDSEREMTHLVAINLKLADIEFADTHTALWRSKLQALLLKLKRLGSQYQKLQQEKARADAEHAWRATWFEED